MNTEIETLLDLADRTKAVLDIYDLDQTDSRNVARWEKLSKLYLQLMKQVARLQAKEPEEFDIEV